MNVAKYEPTLPLFLRESNFILRNWISQGTVKIIYTRLIRLKVSIGLHYASENAWKSALVRIYYV
jgi:hypothetical protein